MKQELSYAELLEKVHLPAADRAAALASLERAEAIAAAVYRATQAVQTAAESIRRGVHALGERIRARFA